MSETGYVLLHGAMLGGWIWERCAPLLVGPSIAVDLPGRGNRPADLPRVTLEEVIDSVASDVEAFEADRVVLVAHSVSGILVPGLLARLGDRVAQTVYVSAAVPEPGSSYLDMLPTGERLFFRLILRLQRKGPLTPGWAARGALCNDLDEPTTEMVLERLTRELPRLYTDPVPNGPTSSVPALYVTLSTDRAVSADLQRQWIGRLPSPRVESLEAGHLPMLGQPQRLAEILNSVER